MVHPIHGPPYTWHMYQYGPPYTRHMYQYGPPYTRHMYQYGHTFINLVTTFLRCPCLHRPAAAHISNRHRSLQLIHVKVGRAFGAAARWHYAAVGQNVWHRRAPNPMPRLHANARNDHTTNTHTHTLLPCVLIMSTAMPIPQFLCGGSLWYNWHWVRFSCIRHSATFNKL